MCRLLYLEIADMRLALGEFFAHAVELFVFARQFFPHRSVRFGAVPRIHGQIPSAPLRIREQGRASKSAAALKELRPGSVARIVPLEFGELVLTRHKFPDELHHELLRKRLLAHSEFPACAPLCILAPPSC